MTPNLIELIVQAFSDRIALQNSRMVEAKSTLPLFNNFTVEMLREVLASIPEMPQVDDYKAALKTLLKEADNLTEHLTARIEQLEGALKIVAEWDLPKTGKTWESGGEMSYEAAFGTNGSRDYMKQIASNALLPAPPTKTE